MGFSQKIKDEVLEKSDHTCCWCRSKDRFIEIHHINPQAKKGTDDFDNAAPLCPLCHSHLGNNPDMQKQMKSRRNFLYSRNKQGELTLERIEESTKKIVSQVLEGVFEEKEATVSDEERILVEINEDKITYFELNELYSKIPEKSRKKITKLDLLEQSINEKLLVQLAIRKKVEVSSDEINEFFLLILEENNIELDELEKKLDEQNLTLLDLKDEIETQVLLTKLVEDLKIKSDQFHSYVQILRDESEIHYSAENLYYLIEEEKYAGKKKIDEVELERRYAPQYLLEIGDKINIEGFEITLNKIVESQGVFLDFGNDEIFFPDKLYSKVLTHSIFVSIKNSDSIILKIVKDY